MGNAIGGETNKREYVGRKIVDAALFSRQFMEANKLVLDFCKVQLDERQVRLDFGQTPPLFGSLDNPGDGFPQDLA